jgi:hypothetical protein
MAEGKEVLCIFPSWEGAMMGRRRLVWACGELERDWGCSFEKAGAFFGARAPWGIDGRECEAVNVLYDFCIFPSRRNILQNHSPTIAPDSCVTLTSFRIRFWW